MRLFVAVAPPPAVREHLEFALTSVRGASGSDDSRRSLRWAPAADRHVTLAFYGEVSAGDAEELTGGLARIAAESPPFGVRLRGAGVFDRRTLWIGCGGEVDALAALTSRCVDLGREVTGRDDHRVRSRSHLTVARVPGPARSRKPGRNRNCGRGGADELDDLAAFAHALAIYEGPMWEVGEIVLASSRPGEGKGGGPAYDPLLAYPLAGSELPAVWRAVAG